MSLEILVMLDSSGSCYEMSKFRLERNLARTITQLQLLSDNEIYKHIKFSFFSFNENINPLVLTADGDIPEIKARGKVDLKSLCSFLEQYINGDHQVIIISDGSYPYDQISYFRQWLKEHIGINIIFIPIGIDANIENIKLLTNHIFSADNILLAIDYAIIYSLKIPVKIPNSINDIVDFDLNSFEHNSANTIEEEDEW